MALTDQEVLEIVKAHFPPKFFDWFLAESGDGALGDLLAACADELNENAFTLAETIGREVFPSTASERLTDWEVALSLGPAKVTTDAARQARIVSKLRESGASTLPNIRAAIAPLLGYADPSTLAISEVSRAALTALHTYASTGATVIGVGATIARGVVVADDGAVSQAGAQLTIEISATDIEDMKLTLTGPDATAKVWAEGTWTRDTGVVANESYTVAAVEFADADILGLWILTVENTGVGTGTLHDMQVFVEGITRDGAGNDGLGAAIFEWSVLADPALIGATNDADYAAAEQAIRLLNPAHCNGFLAFKPTAGGGSCARYDDVTSTYDACTYCT